MGNMETDPIVSYLAERKLRSSIFFNISVLLLATLLAKIATNFVSGEPGFAGFRV
jgi:hypothetical protein